MTTETPQRVSVWLDCGAPGQGAFAHALEWAERLGVPLRGVMAAQAQPNGGPLSFPMLVERLEACAAACDRRGVSWDGSLWQPISGPDPEQPFWRPEMWVLGNNLPPPVKAAALRRSLRNNRATVLVCPASGAVMSRVMVVNLRREPPAPFLGTATHFCRLFGVSPVLLTVARSVREASACEQFAQEQMAGQGMSASHDSVIGGDVAAAISRIARWRRCSHVFVERHDVPPWLRWLRRGVPEQLLPLAGSHTLLTLPPIEGSADCATAPAGQVGASTNRLFRKPLAPASGASGTDSD